MQLQAQLFVRPVVGTQHSHAHHHCHESDVKQMHQLTVNSVTTTFAARHACNSVKVCKAVVVADLADDGTIRRRGSGRSRSGKLQHHSDHHNAAPTLYTVVTMDPNDEVSKFILVYCMVCSWQHPINCFSTWTGTHSCNDHASSATLHHLIHPCHCEKQ